MPDDDKGNTDESALAQQITDLTRQLTEAQQTITGFDAVRTELADLRKANGTLNADFTALKTERDGLQQQLDGKGGDFTNLKTQFDQLQVTSTETSQKLVGTEAELALYKMIAGNEQYYPLIGMVDSIKITPDAESQKKVLDSMAGAFQTQKQTWVNDFQQGATTLSGPANQQQQPGPKNELPDTIEGVHALMQRTDPRTDRVRWGQLQQKMIELQDQQDQGGVETPN